jgi:hypothetical protein
VGISTLATTDQGFIGRRAANRSDRGRVLFVEDFRHPVLGMWNDGAGAAYRDNEITFGGLPSVRLDPQGSASGNASVPGTIDTNGVVFKRRIQDSFSGRFAVELWIRHTTTASQGAQNYFVVSHYNRDGVNAWHARLWFDTSGGVTSTALRYAQSGGSWPTLATITDQGNAQHTYALAGNLKDKAGQWWYVKLCADFVTKKYVYAQYGDHFYDMSGLDLHTAASSSQAVMHFSAEYAAVGTSARYVNIAQVIGSRES